MHSYLSRAEDVYRDKQNDSEACGNISYLLWGGLAGLSWSRNKLRELGELQENQQPSITSSYPGQSSGMISGSEEVGEPSDEDYLLPEGTAKVYGNEADPRKILFPTQEMAEEFAKMLDCEVIHTKQKTKVLILCPANHIQ